MTFVTNTSYPPQVFEQSLFLFLFKKTNPYLLCEEEEAAAAAVAATAAAAAATAARAAAASGSREPSLTAGPLAGTAGRA